MDIYEVINFETAIRIQEKKKYKGNVVPKSPEPEIPEIKSPEPIFKLDL